MHEDANLSPAEKQCTSDVLFTLLLALAGALLSLGISGYVWGTNNSIFHLPILAALYNEPQFADDVYMQSLRYYASGFWILLRGSANWLSPAVLFPVANVVSRLLVFWGFLACAEVLGITRRRDRILFTLILAGLRMLYGYAYAGDGGLFINSFTQSEIANGLSLLCLAAMARRRVALALALNGLVFFLNIFNAAWNFVPLALIAVLLLRKDSRKAGILIRRVLPGAAVFLLFAAPGAANLLANPSFGRPVSFSYVRYLAEYWPMHFLFSFIPLKEKIKAIVLLLLATYLLAKNGAKARVFLLALAGYAAVFVFGIAVPHLTQSTLVLNLHLLRVTTFFHLLAALGAAALLVEWLKDADPLRSRVLAPFGFALLCAPTVFVLFPVLAESGRLRFLAHGLRALAGKLPTLAPACALLCACAGVAVNVCAFSAENRSERQQVATYQQLGAWARTTPDDTVFLLPTRGFYSRSAPQLPESFNDNSGIFEYTAHRQVWVDSKRGAAVMWYPPYYGTWHKRLSEVVSLATLGQKLAYAQQHGIGYVVDNCAPGRSAPAYSTATLCAYRVPAP